MKKLILLFLVDNFYHVSCLLSLLVLLFPLGYFYSLNNYKVKYITV